MSQQASKKKVRKQTKKQRKNNLTKTKGLDFRLLPGSVQNLCELLREASRSWRVGDFLYFSLTSCGSFHDFGMCRQMYTSVYIQTCIPQTKFITPSDFSVSFMSRTRSLPHVVLRTRPKTHKSILPCKTALIKRKS